MKRNIIPLILSVIVLLIFTGCNSKEIINEEDIDVGYLEDNVAVINVKENHPEHYESQAVSFVVSNLHSRGKIITSISFIPYDEGHNNGAEEIYIVYTDAK